MQGLKLALNKSMRAPEDEQGIYNCEYPNLKDTHRETAPTNETTALTKGTNIGIWVVGTKNQLFIRGSSTETKLSEKSSSYWQNSVLCDRSIL